MGITGLLPEVKHAIRTIHDLNEFRGQTVVVDANVWIHRGAFGQGDKMYFKEEGACNFINYIIRNVEYLIQCGLKPILVFDGLKLPAKAATSEKRRQTRIKVEEEVEKLLKQKKEKAARDILRKKWMHVTQEVVKQVIDAVREKNYQYIVAPFEADAQMAFLVHNGYADFALSVDSDLILFGIKKILLKYKPDPNGTFFGELFEQEHLKEPLRDINYLRRMCIISGCDYLPSLEGVGLAKAKRFMSSVGEFDISSLERLPQIAGLKNVAVVPEAYIEGFRRAEHTFNHQLVICPKSKSFVPLTPFPDDMARSSSQGSGGDHSEFLLDSKMALDFALGNVDNVSKKLTDKYRPKTIWLYKVDLCSKRKRSTVDLKAMKGIKKLCSQNPYDLSMYNIEESEGEDDDATSGANSSQSSESGIGSLTPSVASSQATTDVSQ